jgi:hypothetical protein
MQIDTKTCSISGIIDYPIPSLSLTPTSFMEVGNTQISLLVDFLAPTLVDLSTDIIAITVYSNSTTDLLVYCLSIAVKTNVTSQGLPVGNTTNGVTFPTTVKANTIAAGTATEINTGIFLQSLVASGTQYVFVQFFRNGSSYSSNTASLTISPNQLLSASFVPTSSLVSATTTYSFVMQTNNPLGVGCGVLITLPTNISILTGTCSVAASLSITNALSSVILCTASTSQTILVYNLSTTLLAGSTTITLNVSGIPTLRPQRPRTPYPTKPITRYLT